ncbi:MAG: VacJ family lipoprotein [Candidatus Omnitrophota bacterium]
MKTMIIWLAASFSMVLMVELGLLATAQAAEYAKTSKSAPLDHFDVDEDIDFYEENITINDPFEDYNRFMFKVNDWVYRRLFNPIAKGYDFVAPKPVQKCFDNLFENAKSTIPFFNNLFQKKYKNAATVFGRFTVNSTIGIGGLFDPAQKYLHWSAYDEDFGQTLGYYGMKTGPYIILPLLGPSTGRDVLGYIGDRALNPFTWIGVYDVYPEEVFEHLPYLQYVNAYAYRQRENYEAVMDGAIAPYAALQNFYVQIRESKIKE